ncbi:hypothetical protein C8T65DRAFT_143101 [Cerioporus squamosus]|nr:hypothetical protein C8T65DRAFT_143101 [Cerioporus squamosus]
MPTWNDYNPLRNFETVGHVLRYMHCTLKGLSFLHSRRVAHRDIDVQNIMSNFYTLGGRSSVFKDRLIQRGRTSRILYCLFDFNLSMQFPLDMPLRECRVVTKNCIFSHSPYMPLDTCFGEYDYDPFAYDVAFLGNMFRARFATIAGDVPQLALLFDRMTTHVIRDRLSASEAFLYFDQMVKQLPDHVLESDAVLDPSLNLKDADRYWSLIPPELAAAWAKYRTPPVSLRYNILDHILRYRFSRTVLLYVRGKLRI